MVFPFYRRFVFIGMSLNGFLAFIKKKIGTIEEFCIIRTGGPKKLGHIKKITIYRRTFQ
jgi:hypothetical protein